MSNNMFVLFFLYKSKTNSKGTTPIFCRLTQNAKRKQFSTGIYIKDSTWNGQAQKVKGTSQEALIINSNLDVVRLKLNKCFSDLLKEKPEFSLDDVYNRFTGNDREYKTILQAFDYHNKRMKELVGKDYVQATYDKFVVIQNHVEAFIKHQYNLPDYALANIKLNFLTDLDHYLKVTKDLNQNTINKVIERVKKVMKIAVGNGWIASDPFLLYQKKKYTKEVVFLTAKELAQLEKFRFAQDRLVAIRDCFIFSCYTGLAFNEAALLEDKHIIADDNGNLWIEMIRQKTQRPIAVLLLPKALAVLKKYGYPNITGTLLPTISNQKMNSYIKEVADVVGINKHLTHHIARKTFASTVLLGNDIPIEIVSFLLGHSKTATTENHYAKVVKGSVLKHMSALSKKMK
ncbi:site-specific integrase [Mucilaginibacter sp. 21P]|uniref:site-specific integrase n=1 Tax=Mucilaginibacter sp. 21P TaxID=2778902 RepID=UPI001C59C0AC|nr:site-specific integrase [Mucilaginibacter sp. 21P]QXV66092.1 site-specific integrase [Mucilaginibacter sp. 21P]